MADCVAAVAGTDRSAVLIDRVAHAIRATAQPLPGATFATYRALEAHAAQPGWTVTLVPPPVAPPIIPWRDGKADQAPLDDIAWGARRLGYAVTVAGGTTQDDAVIGALRRRA